jgi:hypothetical protein
VARPKGYTHCVVEGVCRRVVAEGHMRNRRVRATNKVVECTEHSSSGSSGALKDPQGAPPSYLNNNNSQMTT